MRNGQERQVSVRDRKWTGELLVSSRVVEGKPNKAPDGSPSKRKIRTYKVCKSKMDMNRSEIQNIEFN